MQHSMINHVAFYTEIIVMSTDSAEEGAEKDVCDKCVTDFAAAGGCECIKKEDCNQLSLIPEGCIACGGKAIEYCGTEND